MEKVKKEAVKRMYKLNMHKNVIRDFEVDILNNSELNGMLYWLDDEKKQIVKDFETGHGVKVYHVIETVTEFGKLLSLLYVPKNEDEWIQDNEDLEDNIIFAYVVNLDEPTFSEYGTIKIKNKNGGLVRVQ